MRRGEIRWVALSAGSDRQAKAQRPAIIVSNAGANAAAARRGTGVVTVVPLITADGAAKSFQVSIPPGTGGLRTGAKALTEQVRTVSAARIGPSIGALPLDVMRQVDAALRLHLGL